MALKKSDLYASLWASCDQLRGSMGASQYKDYILTLLFVKYVSDKAKVDPNSLIDVPAGGSFDDMLAAKGDKEIGDRFNKIIARLAEANGLRNVIDQADFNDEEKLGKGKEMQDRLSKLVTIFNDLDFRGSRAEGDDLLGDAYEYLMRHFATESGKSKGQFYTPANRETRHLWFNVELAKKHPDCLEYIVVHEMTHYFERNHEERFTKLMDKYLPDWRRRRDQLNGAPLAEETW